MLDEGQSGERKRVLPRQPLRAAARRDQCERGHPTTSTASHSSIARSPSQPLHLGDVPPCAAETKSRSAATYVASSADAFSSQSDSSEGSKRTGPPQSQAIVPRSPTQRERLLYARSRKSMWIDVRAPPSWRQMSSAT